VRGSHKERRNSTRIPEIRQLVTQMNNLHVNIFQRDSIRDAVQSALSAGLEKKDTYHAYMCISPIAVYSSAG